MSAETDIRSFQVDMPDEAIADLRRRITAVRWPSKELVKDRSQGVQLATIQELARYWTTDYDWRACEARLNALPQFKTEIGGVDIHFIHVRSPHAGALPLIITHGWPGSVIELLEVIGPLTDPAAYGGSAEDAFDLVLPSLPGYGLSAEPAEVGWDPGRIAQAWAELMRRLGYDRYVAQGGDQGAAVTDAMGGQAPEGLAGIHLNFLRNALGTVSGLPADSEEERAALAAINTFMTSGFGYFLEQATRQEAGVASRIELRVGPGLETLRALPPGEQFDFAFIDADKTGYARYYEEILTRMRPGGLMLLDNTLQGGHVASDLAGDEDVAAIRSLNDAIAADPRVKVVLLPIGDGVSIVQKLGDRQ